MPHDFPKLHNAAWPGVVGKGPDSEPPIPLDTMVDLTAGAEVDGQKFDGIDLFLAEPHISVDSDETTLRGIADRIQSKGLAIGSFVAPVWPPAGGGSAMDPVDGRRAFLTAVRKSCDIGKKLRDWGYRPSGVVRIDSATSVEEWAQGDVEENQEIIAETFRQACDIAADFGETLAAEGEICWGGMHSWKRMVELLEMVDRDNLGFQADMAHTLLYTLGYNAPEDRILPPDYDWSNGRTLDEALKKLTDALRPWTVDFHVAQNDATVFGSGTHDKTGRHCRATDPDGKLDIPKHAGFWLRDEKGELTKKMRHICWDGCMFPNKVMTDQETWNDVLRAMIRVRDAHGWDE